jgi:ABC-type lipoprotein release transport system permease subunit
MRLIAGRAFDARDVFGRPPVAIINETMARRFWPGERAIGKRLSRRDGNAPSLEVVGVVNDVTFPGNMSEAYTRLQAFRPLAQAPIIGVSLALRTSLPPERLLETVRRALAEVDPMQPIGQLRTARSQVDVGLGRISLLGGLLGAFAVLGLTLAAVGIYAVTSYSVAQRTNELGIRMVLGAQARDVLLLILRTGMLPIVAGAALGIGGAFAVARLLAAAIPTLPTQDFATMAAVMATLVGVAFLACYLPAFRATRLDPSVALRRE